MNRGILYGFIFVASDRNDYSDYHRGYHCVQKVGQPQVCCCLEMLDLDLRKTAYFFRELGFI